MASYSIDVVKFRVVREGSCSRRIISSPLDVVALTKQLIPDDAKEHFGVLMLDSQNRFLSYHEVSVGTLSASLVHPREVFAPAFRLMGVASLVLVHNHPSGDPTPSPEDLRLTRQLADCARLLDVRLHDHVVLGSGTGQWVSFVQGGLL